MRTIIETSKVDLEAQCPALKIESIDARLRIALDAPTLLVE